MSKEKLVYPNEGYSSSGSDADYEQPTDELNRTMAEPKTFKEFIRWLEVWSPVDWEEMQRFEDENVCKINITQRQDPAGASVWIRFDLDKEEDDD